MRRRTFDAIVSATGVALAVLLLVAGGLLTWANSFVSEQVRDQLSAQKIYFPEGGAENFDPAVYPDLQQWAGQQVLTGEQAKGYANGYIGRHLEQMTGGKSYSEVSAEARANPQNAELAELRQTVFMGETLRGLLLNAYAFDTMGRIAAIAAIAAYAGAAVLLLLAVLGLWHLRRVPEDVELFATRRTQLPVGATG